MSKLTACPDCNHQVSRSAKKCPNCGKRVPNPSMLIAKGLMVLLGVLIWGGWTQSMLNPPKDAVDIRLDEFSRSTEKALETFEKNK